MGGGQIKFADNGKLMIGDSNDLQIFHNGTDSIIYNGTGAYMVRANDFRIQSSDASSTKLIVDSSGNVGIGTTSPTTKLHVVGTNNTTAFKVDFPSADFDFSANSTSGYTTSFHMDNTGTYIGSNSAGRALIFQTNIKNHHA